MKKKALQRAIALCLALVFCLGVLASCGDGDKDVVGDGGDRGENGSWDGVNFGGQAVNFCISVNQYEEATFPAADLYTRGPDTAGSNEVAKEVIARNAAASKDLGITITYTERNLRYPDVAEDIRKIVQTSAKNSPDIYNNDLCGLARGMVEGLLWNVKDPGDDLKNYFDFEADGWYTEYIKGCTFDQDKLYIVAGDYFIDMIRMAWVILVNNDILQNNLNKMPAWCSSVSEFYEYVDSGMWELDIMIDMVGRVFVDSGVQGVTEKTDTLVGLSMNHVTNWVISANSGVTLYYQDENYEPKVMQSIDMYQKVANKYKELKEKPGVYLSASTVEGVLESTTHFLDGAVLFAASRLGEMESAALRDFSANKGLVPFPKWEYDEQEDYHTTIHNQVELGAILASAKAYSAASALLQYLNENSSSVVYTYYEKGLKYKYNDDENARAMMDIVRETSGSPFGFEIGDFCQTLYTGSGTLKGLYIRDYDTIGSTYASEKDAYNDCMKRMIEKFEELE